MPRMAKRPPTTPKRTVDTTSGSPHDLSPSLGAPEPRGNLGGQGRNKTDHLCGSRARARGRHFQERDLWNIYIILL